MTTWNPKNTPYCQVGYGICLQSYLDFVFKISYLFCELTQQQTPKILVFKIQSQFQFSP